MPTCRTPVNASRTRRPSVPPSNSSLQRSGCGMRPTTFPAAFATPAMFAVLPFGFASGVAAPRASV